MMSGPSFPPPRSLPLGAAPFYETSDGTSGHWGASLLVVHLICGIIRVKIQTGARLLLLDSL